MNDNQLRKLVNDSMFDLVESKLTEKAKNARLNMIKAADEFLAYFYDYKKELDEMDVNSDELFSAIPIEYSIQLNETKQAKACLFAQAFTENFNKSTNKLGKDLESFLKPFDRLPEEVKDEYYNA